ncbi:hypothetical protein BC936DRAFT_147536 [Jimgerdemannia flammicorona]|uniref:Methyltransferase type 11 domain-containing protein n=1 Tax=Jimgerdemannia flammicorona TaxID=994334 RepID=A0A433D537_9FUNG|nr:hypothetical protein BC936DRAFT_147536 [Jimgerdemannia flammicorona]
MDTIGHLHPSAKSWDAEKYESGRPSYSTEAVTVIARNTNLLSFSSFGKRKVLVDLGAGTGKLTRVLGDFLAQNSNDKAGYKIVAVEPVQEMRDKLADIWATRCDDNSIELEIMEGSGGDELICKHIFAKSIAEQIPLPDKSVDTVIAAQAFHWFASETALREVFEFYRKFRLVHLTSPRYSDRFTVFSSLAVISALSGTYETIRFRSLPNSMISSVATTY